MVGPDGATYTETETTGVWSGPGGELGTWIVNGTGYGQTKSWNPLPARLQPFGSGGGGSDWGPNETQFQYDKLSSEEKRAVDENTQKYVQAGLEAETARRRALTDLITNRNTTNADIYRTSGTIAAQAAQFAANPRDAIADLNFRNAMGGSTPYGSTGGAAGDALQGGLSNKFNELFGGSLAADKARAVQTANSIPPAEFLSPSSGGYPGANYLNPNTTLPSPSGLTWAPPGAPPGAPAPVTTQQGSAQQGAEDYWHAMAGTKNETKYAPAAPKLDTSGFRNPDGSLTQKGADFLNFSSGGKTEYKAGDAGQGGMGSAAKGGTFNFDDLWGNRNNPGASPSSSEGGMNMNIHERAVIMGESGRIYGTLGEKRPDGTVRAENLIIKPLKSETLKDKQMEEKGMPSVEPQGKTLAHFDQGGSVADFLRLTRENLGRVGGTGGGAGNAIDPHTGLAPLKDYAGLNFDPTQMGYLYAAQSQAGVSPELVDWTLKQFTPTSPINNLPRVTF